MSVCRKCGKEVKEEEKSSGDEDNGDDNGDDQNEVIITEISHTPTNPTSNETITITPVGAAVEFVFVHDFNTIRCTVTAGMAFHFGREDSARYGGPVFCFDGFLDGTNPQWIEHTRAGAGKD